MAPEQREDEQAAGRSIPGNGEGVKGMPQPSQPAPAMREPECICGVSAPDEFGNRDRLEHPACPVHAAAPVAILAMRDGKPVAIDILPADQEAIAQDWRDRGLDVSRLPVEDALRIWRMWWIDPQIKVGGSVNA